VIDPLERMTILHTQEVTGSSPVAPTIRINHLEGIVDGAHSRPYHHLGEYFGEPFGSAVICRVAERL